tara:strand:+ start:229 stop:537 length:309 start_codon:yes stop_codon:yes gene_type:complete
MKSLYLGMAIIALVLITLSITIETSSKSPIKLYNRNNNNNNNNNNNQTTYSLKPNSLKNSKPKKGYNQSNLNKELLRTPYNNNNNNNNNNNAWNPISNKFYL